MNQMLWLCISQDLPSLVTLTQLRLASLPQLLVVVVSHHHHHRRLQQYNINMLLCFLFLPLRTFHCILTSLIRTKSSGMETYVLLVSFLIAFIIKYRIVQGELPIRTLQQQPTKASLRFQNSLSSTHCSPDQRESGKLLYMLHIPTYHTAVGRRRRVLAV